MRVFSVRLNKLSFVSIVVKRHVELVRSGRKKIAIVLMLALVSVFLITTTSGQRPRKHLRDAESQGNSVRLIDIMVYKRNQTSMCCAIAAMTDNIAMEAQNNPNLRLVIDGHSSSSENTGTALKRAQFILDYLTKDRRMILDNPLVRIFDDKCPSENGESDSRVEVFFISRDTKASKIKKICSVK